MRWRHALGLVFVLLAVGLALASRVTSSEPDADEPADTTALAELVQRVQEAQGRAIEATKQSREANQRLNETAGGMIEVKAAPAPTPPTP